MGRFSFYNIAKIFFGIRSSRIKLLSIAAAHAAGMRYIGVFLDPVMSCNLRCKMCYFSDDKARPKPTAPLSEQQIDALSSDLLHHALKLQIGCGAEPTLYAHLPKLIEKAHAAGVPYIEITTNGQLLSLEKLMAMIEAGLGGMTLSLHGTTQPTYEYLMGRASFGRLLELIDILREVKRQHPQFKLRINYTFNTMNVAELSGIWSLFEGVKIDVLQVRPIQRLGDTEYGDFDLSDILKHYDTLIQPLADACAQSGTLWVGPSKQNLMEVDQTHSELDEAIEKATYYYVSPTSCYREDYTLGTDTFASYHRRHRTPWRLIKTALSPGRSTTKVSTTKKMNYKMK